jgi:hypothetical protein
MSEFQLIGEVFQSMLNCYIKQTIILNPAVKD